MNFAENMISLGSSEVLSNTSPNPPVAPFTPRHISAKPSTHSSLGLAFADHSPLDKPYFSCVLSLRTRSSPDFPGQHPSGPAPLTRLRTV